MSGVAALMSLDRPSFDPAPILNLIGDDPELLDEVVRHFKKDSLRLLGEIRQAMESLDATNLERASHTLQGMLSHFGESVAHDLASRVEFAAKNRDVAGARSLRAELELEVELVRQDLDRLFS